MRSLTALMAFTAAVTAQSVSSASSAASSMSAQSTGSTNASSTSTGPMTHTIAVGKAGNTFSPDVLQVPVGDVIEFDFYPTNHSVARAAYGYPCVPYELVLGAGHYGFWSGFEPVSAILDDPPKFSITVNNTEPILYYCGAPGSCTQYAMVGVINPNSSTSLAYQKQLALQSSYTLVPGEDWPSEGPANDGLPTTSSSSSSTTSATAAATTSAAVDSTHSSAIGGGAIAGIAIGASAVLLAGAVAIWFCGRQSRKNHVQPSAPAHEVMPGHLSQASFPMYAKHMSTVSGYSMPPGYDPRSPTMSHHVPTPVDPMMEQNMAMPMYSQHSNANMYAVGTHHVAPVEMAGNSMPSPTRKSTDKVGVERYQ